LTFPIGNPEILQFKTANVRKISKLYKIIINNIIIINFNINTDNSVFNKTLIKLSILNLRI